MTTTHQHTYESPREFRNRKGCYDFETLEEMYARRRRQQSSPGETETRDQALWGAYRLARSDWAVWHWHNQNRWCGLDQAGLDLLQGSRDRAIELRNMIYGTED